MIRAQVETCSSFPSLDLVPILHYVPMTQRHNWRLIKPALNFRALRHSIIPFQEWSLETIDDQIQKCMLVTL